MTLRLVSSFSTILKPGDYVTMEGAYQRNPLWRWWKPWQPKSLPYLQRFVVVDRDTHDAMSEALTA